METNIWEEISKIKNPRRKAYFQWKHGIENIKKDYGAMTKEEFVKYCNKIGVKVSNPEQFLKYLERWESSPEYKRLLFLLKEDEFATDLLDVYKTVKKKALEGNSQAIKNMVMLQNEIKKYRKSIDKYFKHEEQEQLEEEKDDGLII